MIELYNLEQLVIYAECGTLSKAAENLHISQPSLTRSMQKIEDEFRVPLFDREKNKIVLNENGILAVDHARRILKESREMIESVRNFDRSHHTISLGFCAPAPLWSIYPALSSAFPMMTISAELKGNDSLKAGLLDETYQIVIFPSEIKDENVECVRWGTENLFFYVHKSHKLSKSKSLHLADLDGENILLFSEIGFWHDVVAKKMPRSRFLLQSERFAMNELVNSSFLTAFTTDLVMKNPLQYADSKDRVAIPILDDEIHVTYWCCCLKKNRPAMKCQLDD